LGRGDQREHAVAIQTEAAVLTSTLRLRAHTSWLIVGAPEELECLPGAKTPPDISLIYLQDLKQFPPELADKERPPKE
jgi:hypothetical protein